MNTIIKKVSLSVLENIHSHLTGTSMIFPNSSNGSLIVDWDEVKAQNIDEEGDIEAETITMLDNQIAEHELEQASYVHLYY